MSFSILQKRDKSYVTKVCVTKSVTKVIVPIFINPFFKKFLKKCYAGGKLPPGYGDFQPK